MSMSLATKIPKRKKRLRLLWFQLLLVIGFLGLVWFSFVQDVLVPRKQSGIPESLGKLELISSVEGAEALAQVNKLHGTGINLVWAYIAKYADKGERITVWVGKAEDSNTAAGLINKMTEGIARSGSGFSNLRQLTIKVSAYSDHNVFQVDGPGGKHFFYLSHGTQDKVVWLTIEAADVMPILNKAVSTFN